MPGSVVTVIAEKGEKIRRGNHLIITEAKKMETTVQAPFDGFIKDIYITG
ncbi:biotin/lipoyl-containing protein [Salimicrobium sp. PL1-032A]